MKKFNTKLIKCICGLFVLIMLSSGNAFAQSMGAGDGATTSISTPVFVGASLGFGSGTGVGTERGLGLRQIEPMLGVWLPGMGFIRAGYGFFEFEENSDKEEYAVEHSDFDIELGLHLKGILYLLGTYSRAKELSDIGDVSWNEWGLGFGSILTMFGKTMLFAEVSYRWVLEHYDPFVNKDVSGSRLQFNLGFAAYVF